MPFATNAAVKLCVRIIRRRPRLAHVVPLVARPVVRRVVPLALLCTAIVPPSLDVPPAPPAAPPAAPPPIVQGPPVVPLILPPGSIIPPGMVYAQIPSVPGTSVPPSSVPEPSTLLLVLGAAGALALLRRPM